MGDVPLHPTINTALNALSGVLLVGGLIAIRGGKRELHGKFMGAAFLASMAFLVSYLIYHYTALHTPYEKQDWTRPVYFAVLISHVILAAVNLPMVLRTLYLAVKKRWPEHRKWARWTTPIWLYVSVTGVVVYGMLYLM
ncbi:MAG: DUF420 domain-containing protein [Planctomycetota bacterium]